MKQTENQAEQCPQPVQVVYATPPLCDEDEIDLFELWEELVSQWRAIVAWVAGFLAVAGLYVVLATPQFEGKLILEPGKMVEKTEKGLVFRNIVEPKDLAYSISEKFKEKKRKKALKASVPRGTKDVVEITYLGATEKQISAKMDQIQAFVREAEQRVIKLIQGRDVRYMPARVLVPLKISDEPVKPKRVLILAGAGVLGLFVGVFAVFLRRAAREHRARKAAA